MTYVTGFFLVFAGMLIGYFLWYRDRSEDEQLRLSLERENEDTRTSLKIAHNAHAVLDERFVRQKGQLNVLQQLCDDWSTSREQSERDRAQLEVEVEDKKKKYEVASVELQKSRQKGIELSDQIHDLNQQHLEKIHKIENNWREKHAPVEAGLAQRSTELKSAVKENERLIKSLHQSEAKIAGLKSEIDANKSLLETATKNASGLKQEYVSIESALKVSSDLLKQARSECATALSEKKVAEHSIVTLHAQNEKLHKNLDEVRSQLAGMKSLEQQLDSLKHSLENSQTQLAKVTEQRELALQAEKTSLAMAAGLQNRIDNQESTIHGLREKHKDAMESLKQELQVRSDLETSLEKQKRDIEARINEQKKQLQLHSTELHSKFGQKQTSFEKQLATQTKGIEQLTAQRDELKSALQNSQSVLSKNKAEFDSFKQKTQQMVAELAELKTTGLRIGELEKLLAERDARLAVETEKIQSAGRHAQELQKRLVEREQHLHIKSQELQSSLLKASEFEKLLAHHSEQSRQLTSDMERLHQQQAASQTRQAELQSELQRRAADSEHLAAIKLEFEAQIESMRAKLKASEETIRTLRRERAGVLARLANYRTIAEPDATVISFTQAMEQKKQGTYDREYGGHTRHDSVRGVVYTTEPDTRDDLKRISGIAEVLEARLNDFGIYTFKQIMDWQPEAIEEFSRLLAFRERIVRDDWKGQAKFFYEQKSNTAKKAAA